LRFYLDQKKSFGWKNLKRKTIMSKFVFDVDVVVVVVVVVVATSYNVICR
jgi:hypothetical protein